MFYICKGCGDACNGCGKACDGACKGCGQCWHEVEKACGSVCNPICKVMDRPLGTYVLITWLFNIPVLAIAASSITREEVRSCEAKPLMLLCGVNAALAVVNAGFALYLQIRLLNGLDRSGSTEGLQPKDIMKRAWDIILYDFGFLFYIIVFIGSFGFNCYASGWSGACGGGIAVLPGVLLIVFSFFAFNFGILWFLAMACQSCCGGSTASRLVLGKNFATPGYVHYSGQPPVVMGQPAQQGYAAAPAPQQMPAAQAQQAMYHGGSAPPPGQPAQPTAGQQAAGAAAGAAGAALGLAGGALQAAGGWLAGKKGQSGTRE